MTWFATSLRENPELAIFLTLALGFVIGRLRFGTFALGNVVGTLLAGVLVGQLDIRVDPIVKVVFFDLFLFATGYKVGPQFFRGLKKDERVSQPPHRRPLRRQPRDHGRRSPGSWATTRALRPGSWPAPLPNPPSSAPRATRSPASTSPRTRRNGC